MIPARKEKRDKFLPRKSNKNFLGSIQLNVLKFCSGASLFKHVCTLSPWEGVLRYVARANL